MIRLAALLAWLALPIAAETVVAARTLPARTIVAPEDVLVRDVQAFGAVQDPHEVIGMETRVALYAGRPVRPGDVGPPAIVERNQIVPLVYNRSGLVISTEGRALDRAGPGEIIRVMNVMSRQTLMARIDAQGVAHVSP